MKSKHIKLGETYVLGNGRKVLVLSATIQGVGLPTEYLVRELPAENPRDVRDTPLRTFTVRSYHIRRGLLHQLRIDAHESRLRAAAQKKEAVREGLAQRLLEALQDLADVGDADISTSRGSDRVSCQITAHGVNCILHGLTLLKEEAASGQKITQD